jgi:tetratricopeptide (TPR) repeat protein
VVVAGWAVALFTLAGGVFVHRALRDVDWTLLAGAATTADIRVPPLPIWEMAAPPLPAFPRAEDRALYEKGRRLLAAGDAKAAVGPLAEAARRLPRDPVVMHDYGLALVHTGRQDLGLFKLEHASRMVPGIGSYRLDLIRALLAAGRRAHAVRELEGLLARDPTNLAAAELRASLPPGMDPEGGVASPGTAAGSMDLGGAAGDGGGESPRPVEGGAAFTNEDLGRRRTVIASPSPPA